MVEAALLASVRNSLRTRSMSRTAERVDDGSPARPELRPH
jgi:hypothetical protein